jgi:hypothetical protein
MRLVNKQFGTNPLVVHAQGFHADKPHWPPIRDAFFAQPPRQLGPAEGLAIITFNNGHQAMGLLERGLEHLGVPCHVLGRGIDPWLNSRDKPRLVLQALDELDGELILGLDSRDVLVLDDPRLIVRRFLGEFDCDLLFSADRMSWPAIMAFKRYEDSLPGADRSDFRYLNGGAWIGRREMVRQFFAAAVETAPLPQAPESEQGILKQLLPRFHPRVQLDYQCRIFQNIGFVAGPILAIE